MKINTNHLKDFIKVPKNLAEITNDYITEVESFNKICNINNVVIGKVIEKVKHPNADKLSITQVDLGNKSTQIVCGAKNVESGQYVVVALEGAVLPGDFKIKKSKIRDIESNGMICSLKELGIEESLIPEEFREGIYYFKEEKELGTDALMHLELDGYVLELSLTPNRSDLLSVYGFARDLSAITNEKIELKSFPFSEETKENPLNIIIESKDVNSYYARYIEDVIVKDSPAWLQTILKSMDVEPINNVVDITNYILYTYGLPMHGFDALKFEKKNIVIKNNRKEETIKLLDQSERKLTGEEILITNGEKNCALAGIMGLDNTKIDNNTKDIILEIASFSREKIRDTSKKLSLKSDSSLRFERGIDETLMMQALNHASYLIKELASGKVLKGIKGELINKYDNPNITIHLEQINKKTGNIFKLDEIIDILKRLNYQITLNDNNTLTVKAPTYRTDILISDDILEEIIRIYGMNKIEEKELKTNTTGGLSFNQKVVRKIRHLLANIGMNEIITYSLMKEEEATKYNSFDQTVSVLKPQTQDRKTLRQSLINGLVQVTNYNKDRSTKVNLFEIGHVYSKNEEKNHLGVSLSKPLKDDGFKKTKEELDFYYARAILDKVMNLLNKSYMLIESENKELHPYQQANIIVDKKEVGIIGKLHPKNSKSDVFIFEINLDELIKEEKIKYEPVSKYPNVERDIAVILKDEVKLGDVINMIKQTIKNDLVSADVFDIYKGDNISDNHKSVAIKLIFNNKAATLEGKDVDKHINKILKRIEFEYDGKMRS